MLNLDVVYLATICLLTSLYPDWVSISLQRTKNDDEYRKQKKENCSTMKICMLAYSFYDNDARVRRYAEALARRGDHVDVFALKIDAQQEAHEVINGVNIYRIQKRIMDEKGKLKYLCKMLLFLINSSYRLAKKYVGFHYDLVHVHSLPDFEVFAAILPKIFGAKIILDIHDPVPDFFMAKFNTGENNIYIKILSFIERITTMFADHVITVTDYWKGRIAERSQITDNKITVILNLPDLRVFNYRNFVKKHKSNDDFIMLYPGTLNKHCGLDIAIRAVNNVKDEIPSIKLLIYGKGGELDNLNQMVKDFGLQDIVLFFDVVPLESIPKIMCDADIGIALLAGHNEYSQQALNVKLFEFLSMGLPAIATRTKSIEYYLNEGTVMLSNPNDPADVARCIRQLYLNPSKRYELTEKGLSFIKTNNSEYQLSRYLRIVDNLVNKIY